MAPKKQKPQRDASSAARSALVLGIAAAVGTDIDGFDAKLKKELLTFGYRPQSIRMTELLRLFDKRARKIPETPQGKRIASFMNAGNRLRAKHSNEVLALLAAGEIKRRRSDQDDAETAYVVRTLKHPDEVTALRRIYGHGFFLLGVYSDESSRLAHLHLQDVARVEAEGLVRRDQEEADPAGQQTRKTFALSDVFVRSDDETDALGRTLRLLFGDPSLTPTKDEYAMFLSYSASLRSGDLSRQVGAVVVNRDGDVIASGANDVPRSGGGLYWPGADDRRDYVRGFDSNEKMRNEAIVAVMRAVGRTGTDEKLFAEGKDLLQSTVLLDITEFGRAVHAEMEALLCCARTGASPVDGTLYTTTFPCHNCAKHIVAAGIKRVVFVEPYAKSRVRELFDDSIAIEKSEGDKVRFEPFIGLGPRRFIDLYGMSLGTGYRLERKTDGKARAWDKKSAQPRVPMLPNSYRERENLAMDTLERKMGS